MKNVGANLSRDYPRPGAGHRCRSLVERHGILLLAAATGALTLALYGANLVFGPLNQDEGWYLYAARLWAGGLRPYADFFFTQGPLMPAIYGFLHPLWGPSGVAGGRLLTALAGMVSVVLTAWLAGRLAGRGSRHGAAALTAAMLIGGNVVYCYFTTIPKTYAISAVLLLAGALSLSMVHDRRRGSAGAAAASAVALAAATGVRLSLAVVPLVCGLWLLRHRRRFGWSWIAFSLAGLAILGLIYGRIVVAHWPAFRFGLGFHAAREGGRGLDALLLAGGSLSRTVQAYIMLVVALFGLGLARVLTVDRKHQLETASRAPEQETPPVTAPLAGGVILAFLVHLASPHPYDDYQTPVMPLLAAIVSAALWRRLPWGEQPLSRLAVLSAIWLCVAAGAFSSPMIQDWFVIGQDRFWPRFKTEPDLLRLRRAGRWLRDHSQTGDLILTQDTYLAVEANRQVPPGLEMGPFSFFAGLDANLARRFNVVNRDIMRQIISDARAPLAAVSGYGFAINAPAMTPIDQAEREQWLALLGRHYEPVKELADFGQHHTRLTVWRRTTTP